MRLTAIYMYGKIFRIALAFVASTRPLFLRPRFLFVDFLVRIWLEKAFLRLIFPEPVALKRFAAPLFVFIFGMFITPFYIIYIGAITLMH